MYIDSRPVFLVLKCPETGKDELLVEADRWTTAATVFGRSRRTSDITGLRGKLHTNTKYWEGNNVCVIALPIRSAAGRCGVIITQSKLHGLMASRHAEPQVNTKQSLSVCSLYASLTPGLHSTTVYNTRG